MSLDPCSFDDLYRAEYDQQVRRSFLLLGNSADAAEAVADAFVSVLERWSKIEEPGPYLHRCVVNSCRDIAGKRKRRALQQPNEPSNHQSAVGAEIEIAELLLALPFRQRAMVVLRYYGGLTEAEIAEALDCRPGSVGPTLHRALAKLRKALA